MSSGPKIDGFDYDVEQESLSLRIAVSESDCAALIGRLIDAVSDAVPKRRRREPSPEKPLEVELRVEGVFDGHELMDSRVVDRAKRALVTLRGQFGYDSTEDAYSIATGKGESWPLSPSEDDYMAVIQLAALCDYLAEDGQELPVTHADFLEYAWRSGKPEFEPLFVRGERKIG